MEKPDKEDTVITRGRDDSAMLEERLNDLLTYDDRQKVWNWLSKERPDTWAGMDTQQKEAATKRRSEQIVKKIKELSPGLWDTLDPEQKRELFNAWLTEHTTSPPGEASEMEQVSTPVPSQKGSPEPVTEQEFPGFSAWNVQQWKKNPNFTTDSSERLRKYNAAKRAFEEQN